MKTVSLPTHYAQTPFDNFLEFKYFLLDSFKEIPVEANSKITKTDWGNAKDFNSRHWARYILPSLSYNLTNLAKSLGHGGVTLNDLWFQQYTQNSTHGWHIHSSHYTGVLYVELPPETPKTQLIFGNKIQEIDASEGDIVIFPSFVVHRSPKNFSNLQKTILSFNIDFIISQNYSIE